MEDLDTLISRVSILSTIFLNLLNGNGVNAGAIQAARQSLAFAMQELEEAYDERAAARGQ